MTALNTMTSLREQQSKIIINMLNYNESEKKETNSLLTPTLVNKKEEKPNWKILVFDEYCQSLIALLLRVNHLRENGVTLHLPLNSKRMPIRDVPAVYLIKPTVENINRVLQDLSANLYDSYYINFSSTLPRNLLEYFADAAVKQGVNEQISQVYDQYLNYLCLEPDLFTLNIKDSYKMINDTTTEESKLEFMMEEISIGLLSVLISLGQIPIIKATRGNAAEMVAKNLDMKLKELARSPSNNINNQDNLFSNSKNRPVLIIIDRNMDLIPMISHSWNYQPLIHDLLKFENNQVLIEVEENEKIIKKKYDIDDKDFFWKKNAHLPIPEIAKEISEELENYRKEADQITKLSGSNSFEDIDFNNNNVNTTKHLKDAINLLPELTVRKNILDFHMNIASNLFKLIENRKIDQLFQMEESILKESHQAILDLLNDEDIQFDDKLRLFLMYYLSHPNLPQNELQAMENILKLLDGDLSPFEAIKKIQLVNKMSTLSAGNAKILNANSSDILDKFSYFSSQFRDGAYSKLMNKVKHFLPSEKELAITKLVQSILDSNNSSKIVDLIHLDPKSKSPISNHSSPIVNINNNFNQVIVFVVGGGSYNEFVNLQEYLKKHPNLKSIVYGSTQILSPNDFLDQLKQV